jgi:hypothetical protein
VGKRMRWILVNPDNPRSLGARTRARRWAMLMSAFPDLEHAKVLDVGGNPRFWRNAPQHPEHVTTVNLSPAAADEPWVTHVVGDACELGNLGTFDLVFSNSLIEHVGGHERRLRLAEFITAASSRYWVQTPYRYFPVEPHFVVPGMQFLPLGPRAAIAARWHAGPRRIPTDEARTMVEWIELIGIRQLRGYFPQARIEIERIGGVPKSIVAVAS